MRHSKLFVVKNQRRVELIHKKYLGAGLTAKEDAEMEKLQKWVSDHVDKRHPIDFSVIKEMKQYRLSRETDEHKEHD